MWRPGKVAIGVVGGLVATTLSRSPLSGQSVTTDQSLAEPGIYGCLLKALSDQPQHSVLVVELLPVPLVRPTESQWDRFGPGAAALRLKGSLAEAGVPFSPAWFHAGTQLASRDEIQKALALDRSAWVPFRQQFSADGYLALSRPLMSDDGLHALVWYRRQWCRICGDGGYAWLHRQSKSDEWRVEQRLVTTAS